MKKIMLCGRPNGPCCPYIEEDEKNDIIYIVNGDQKIILNKKQRQELIKYLCKKELACKCAICNPKKLNEVSVAGLSDR